MLHAVDEHSLQAPFIYDFYTRVVKKKPAKNEAIIAIEALREALLRSEVYLTVRDLGAGSRVNSNPQRKIRDIAKSSLSTQKFSGFLCRLIRHYEVTDIVELGTSLGINTLYMASARDHVRVTTFEGCAETASLAKQNFRALGKEDIRLIKGDISETLPGYLSAKPAVDLVYFDANHQYQATLRYFHAFLDHITPQTIFVFDDIHWSSGMEKAWKEIQQHSKVTLSVDLFDAGIVFFRTGLEKRHYVLAF